VTNRDHESERGPSEGPVIRDRRRFDPATGALREPGPGVGQAPAAGGSPYAEAGGAPQSVGDLADDVAFELQRQIEERTADLQRLQAEYVNYRKRVERDRELVREVAVGNVLTNLLPVLDDVGRARDHGELTGGFKQVGEALEATVEKLGLARYGEPGDPFDPTIHEALMHRHSPDVTESTCVEILQPGYRFGDRVIRPARVAVADPEEPVQG
jgi:molecular chaperone GrpE